MKVRRQGVPNFHGHNARFNNAAGAIVSDLFGTEKTGPIGYLTSDKFIPKLKGRHAPPPQQETVLAEQFAPTGQNLRFDLAQLGEYERVIFSCLAWGDYSVYVLTGEMGSGKTTTAGYVMGVLRRPRAKPCGHCQQCSGPILVSIDFNEGFSSPDATKVMRIFKKTLFSRLKAELRQLFKKDNLVDRFLAHIQAPENLNSFSIFDDFAQASEDPSWLNLTEAGKSNALFSYISEEAEDVDEELRMLMLLVSFVKLAIRPDSACFVLLLDNIDVVSPEAQFELLMVILSLQGRAGIKILIPMRRSTFERLNNQAAYSFGIINHSGPRPADIVRARIDHFLRIWNEDPRIAALSYPHSEALRRRLHYLLVELDKRSGVIEKIFWLSGASLRQSLFMFERVLINSVIPFDKDPNYRDEALRAVLHGDSPDQEMLTSDRFVVNLLVDPATGQFSLICLRVLQFVAEFSESRSYRTARNLIAILSAINKEWNVRAVQKAVNHLLHTKRPLLWVDGKASYGTPAQMIECNDTIYMTESGDGYLSRLVFDLEYIQEATASVEWKKLDNLPESVFYFSLIERLSLARRCLRIIMKQDMTEANRLKKWIENNVDRPEVTLRLISNRMLLSLGDSVCGILRSSQNIDSKEELRNWLSMIIQGFNNEIALTGKENKDLDVLRRKMVQAIA
jgi:hypothetical protein